jgi:hypothetical protein
MAVSLRLHFATAWPGHTRLGSHDTTNRVHRMRAWSRHAHAAYVGQWSLTVQSAQSGVGSHYPVLSVIQAQAHEWRNGLEVSGSVLPIAQDLAMAWAASVNTTRIAAPLYPDGALDVWIGESADNVRNLSRMPEQAQRELSQAVTAITIRDFEADLTASSDLPALERLKNWRTVQGKQAGRWTQVCPWQEEGYLSLTNSLYALLAT